MKHLTRNEVKIEDLEKKDTRMLNLVILPRDDIIEIIKALDGLKRKLKPLLNRIA